MNAKNSFSPDALKEVKAQITSLSTQLNAVKKQLNRQRVVPIPSKNTYLHEREEGLKEKYADYRDNVLADYIYGLYHPDVVFKEGLQVKSPSYMPIPTTSFRFKETFTIKPNATGNFVLYWYPNFLGTNSELTRIHRPGSEVSVNDFNTMFANCLVNSSVNLDGNTELLNGWYGMAFKRVQQDFEKYRLTSACIKVKYTGKILEQSGMLAAAATYVKQPRVLLSVPVTAEQPGSWEIPLVDCARLSQFCDFDNIRQGQWADTCSVTSDPEGITCTYVPTDPLNQVFVNNATTIDSIDHNNQWDGTRFHTSWSPTNANLSYVICGYGITSQLPCITVEAYYNFEIIVRQEQYPYFNPTTTNTKIHGNRELIDRVVAATQSQGLVTHTKTHDQPGVWTKVRGAFSKAANVMTDVLPYIKPLIKVLV
jgi:hypothetical protein